MMNESHISVSKTARYFTLSQPGEGITDVWFACHGYGQLAADFAKEFECIDAPGRLIVVPEALSRFYIQEGPGFHGRDAKVGATWMTREDRDAEMTDYVNYLDALHDDVFSRVDRAKAHVTVLGFSQGGATANRWVMGGHVRPERLIMWGSLLASDIDLAAAARLFRTVDLKIVYGNHDQFAGDKVISGLRMTLEKNEIRHEIVTFDGGHRLDRETLKQLARPQL